MLLNINTKSLALVRGFWYTIIRKKERRRKIKDKKIKDKKIKVFP